MYHYKKKKRSNKWLWLSLIFISLTTIAAIYFSDFFERDEPYITAPNDIYWNLKKPIKISISDNRGIKSYKVSLIKEDTSITLAKGKGEGKELINLDVNFPAKTFYPKGDTQLKIEATDNSYWNFASGNSATKISNIIVDRKKPEIDIVSKSYGISLGGSAIVIFEVEDKNLENIKITSNHDDEFQVIPFYKEGYYISLIARDLKTRGFRAYIEAYDKAGNKEKKRIRYFNKNKKYKVSHIKLKDSFLNGKITDLYEESFADNEEEVSALDRFIAINETLRNKSSTLIIENTKKILETKANGFNISPFLPLRNYAAVASFGDHRYFYYNKKRVSESYHLGLDLAKTKNAEITASNSAKVVYAGDNGIYGKTPILYHGLGLYSIYSHCHELLVETGDTVEKGTIIAKTGNTGLSLGDHLHLEFRVQGVPVRPAEWMDRKWIELNIEKPIIKAKKIIDSKRA